MKKYKKVPDADLSSAGDDFHILWTMKKSLELLNFDENGLKKVVIEGVEKEMSSAADPTGEKLLGVDLTEYYGGKDFPSAHKIVVSQLKYSTRRADENYTFGKLYEGKKSKSSEGSIIQRLASIFKTFFYDFPREEVLDKLKIKLVSNRKFNESHLKQIDEIQGFLSTNKRKLSINNVLDKLQIGKEPFTKLRDASGLEVKEFTDFIRILDFGDCGVESRQKLNFQLICNISNKSKNTEIHFNSLFQNLWLKVMPENEDRREIVDKDILAAFNFSSIEDLFPVSQDFENIDNIIPREQVEAVLNKIITNSSNKPVCIHGGAGYGKSVFIRQLKSKLPGYNHCILFDSYGAGKYQNPEDKRHLHKNAIPQLANSMAKELGTELLLERNAMNDDYLRQFKKRIIKGVEVLRVINPKANLIFIIDAADNSISAAEVENEKSFVEDIVNLEIPDGCQIVVTTRTHRKNSLELPNDFIDIPLRPFGLKESDLFLKSKFPTASKEQVQSFHRLTNGVPRVQYYSLNIFKRTLEEILNGLKPDGKIVRDFINQQISEAEKKLGKNQKVIVNQFLKYLITLPRPVPKNYLKEIIGVEDGILEGIATDISTGLRFEDGKFSFRDEDFENYVRDNFEITTKEGLKKIAETFIEKSEKEEYASINLGSILYRAGLQDKLIDIVLNRKLLDEPNDPIRKQDVYLRRIQLALKIAAAKEENLTYIKLLFISAEESKSNTALNQLLREYPDLISKYGDEVSLSKFKAEYIGQSWAGRFNLKLAANFSRSAENNAKAVKYLKIAEDWLKWRSKRKKEELKDFPVEIEDISVEMEAVLRTEGIEGAMKALHRWKPRDIRLPVGNSLVKNVLTFSSPESITKWLSYSNYRIDEKVFLVTKLFKLKREIGFDLNNIAKDLRSITRRKKIKFSDRFYYIILEFCGVLIQYNTSPKTVKSILNCVDVSSLKGIPYFFNHYDRGEEKNLMENFLYKKTIITSIKNENLSIDSLYPERLKKIEKEKDFEKRKSLEREKREFQKFYQYALAIYQAQADFLTKRHSSKNTANSIRQICSNISKDYDYKYVIGYGANDHLLYLATKLIDVVLLLDNTEELIDVILDSFDKEISQIKIRFELLKRIVDYKGFNDKSLRIINQLDILIKDSNATAEELTDNYINCLILSDKIDDKSGFGRHFFEKLIGATSEIDYSAFSQIRCLNSFSETGVQTPNPKLAYEYSRFVEYADIKLAGYDKKHFPYLESLLAIGELHLPSVFSIACRWDHRNVCTLNDLIISLVQQSLKNGFINHSVAASLLQLRSRRFRYDDLENLYNLIIRKFDEEEDIDGKATFLRTTLKDLRFKKDQYFIDLIYERIKSGKFLREELLSDYKEYWVFIQQFKDKNESISYKIEENEKSTSINIDDIIYTETESLENVIERILDNEEIYSSNLEIENIFNQIVDKCERKNVIAFLDAFVDIDSSLMSIYSFKSILKKCFEKWNYLPVIKTWAQGNFKRIIKIKFPSFEQENYFDLNSIFEISKTLSINNEDVVGVIKTTLPQRIQFLSNETIYSALGSLNESLSKSENENLLRWILSRWNSKIKNNVADGEWKKELCPPTNSNENIASLLRFLLGHPYKTNRWQAIHVLIELSEYGNIDILKSLVNTQNNKDCGSFQNRKFFFYWMSAKLYLWIAIERISKEGPHLLISLAKKFYETLLGDNSKHVLIREFVKRTCLNLFAYDTTIYTSEEYQYISKINVSSLKPVKEKSLSRKQRKYAQNLGEREWRFPFNSIDTLPYWFDPLGQVFNLSGFDVADIADKIIVEEWGYDGIPNKDDFIRKQLNEREWSKTRNDHGTSPEIEGLSSYYEYHAMFCAANFLLEREPLLEDDSHNDNWEYWLNSRSTASKDFWLANLRDPVPLKPECWKVYENEFDENWRDNISDELFDEQIGFLNKKTGFLNLFGGIKKMVKRNEETVSIRSCFVSNKTSEALLRALHSTKNSMNYYLPLADEEGRYERKKMVDTDFVVEGWLKEISLVSGELDAHDPFFQDIQKSYMRFKPSIEEKFKLSYDKFYKKSFYGEKMISELMNWNEITDYSYRYPANEIESSGFILKVDSKFLLEVLKGENKSLLVRCKIVRQLEERKYKGREEDDRNQIKLYLIKSNGEVRTLRGESYKIG